MKNQVHRARITKELKEAGMTSYGMMKMETEYLPQIIHEQEHIHGVIYGRLGSNIDAVMLVATDRRVLFIDCKPFYKNWDEITYEVVAGVKISFVGPFAGVVLHTRVKDFELRFVNKNCAKKFGTYIEKYIEQQPHSLSVAQPSTQAKEEQPPYQPYRIDQVESLEESRRAELLDDTAVLSTLNPDGGIDTAVVHFVIDQDDSYYFLTKKETRKSKNLSKDSQAVLTIHASGSLKVLTINGSALQETDKKVSKTVHEQIAKFRAYTEGTKLAPITKLQAGEYIVYKIVSASIELKDYSRSSW